VADESVASDAVTVAGGVKLAEGDVR